MHGRRLPNFQNGQGAVWRDNGLGLKLLKRRVCTVNFRLIATAVAVQHDRLNRASHARVLFAQYPREIGEHLVLEELLLLARNLKQRAYGGSLTSDHRECRGLVLYVHAEGNVGL